MHARFKYTKHNQTLMIKVKMISQKQSQIIQFFNKLKLKILHKITQIIKQKKFKRINNRSKIFNFLMKHKIKKNNTLKCYKIIKINLYKKN